MKAVLMPGRAGVCAMAWGLDHTGAPVPPLLCSWPSTNSGEEILGDFFEAESALSEGALSGYDASATLKSNDLCAKLPSES